jgi:non-ribosomal peptide synthetase component F
MSKLAKYNGDNSNEQFWKNLLEDKSYSLLPTDNKRPNILEKEYESITFHFTPETQGYLFSIANDQNKLQVTLFSAYQLLNHRYTNQQESCIIFANADAHIPVYLECDGGQTVDLLLNLASSGIQQSTAHANALYDKNKHQLHSIFIFNSQESYSNNDFFSQTINYNIDLGLVLQQDAKGFNAVFFFNKHLFIESTILKMAHHYQNLLTGILTQPEQKIGAIPMLTPYELKELSLFNDTIKAYPEDKTLNILFEEQAAKTPENIALYVGDATMSYNDLNEKANLLANYLVKQGVSTGENVGLLINRGFDMIIGMYAILKAGGAYVPVDPEYPAERQHYIISNSSINVVLTDAEYPVSSLHDGVSFINLTKCDLSNYKKSNLNLIIDPNQLAYTIYTSGSTGKPKGVMITHTSAVNLVLWVNNTFNVNADDRLLFITSMCFDLSVYDIFGILATGVK